MIFGASVFLAVCVWYLAYDNDKVRSWLQSQDATPTTQSSRVDRTTTAAGVSPELRRSRVSDQPISANSANYNERWRAMQREPALAMRVAQAAKSNDAFEAGAAFHALIIYCGQVANDSPGITALAIARSFQAFKPVGSETFVASPVEKRVREIESARARCDFAGAGMSRETAAQLRADLAAKVADVTDLVTALDGVKSTDLTSLNADQLALLHSGRIDVYARVVDKYFGKLDLSEKSELLRGATALYGPHLAMCSLGDECGANSFRFAHVCANFGACEGETVQEAIRNLLGNKNERLFTEVLTITKNAIEPLKP